MPPPTGQWANFLRNHDELDLGRLTDEERAGGLRAFAPEPGMQLYDRGIRRRLAADAGRRPRGAWSWPTACCSACRARRCSATARRSAWARTCRCRSARACAPPCSGRASRTAASRPRRADALVRPVITEGPFGYQQVNVADQQRDPGSLLNWMERLIRTRKECPEIGWGGCEVLETGNAASSPTAAAGGRGGHHGPQPRRPQGDGPPATRPAARRAGAGAVE